MDRKIKPLFPGGVEEWEGKIWYHHGPPEGECRCCGEYLMGDEIEYCTPCLEEGCADKEEE